MQNFEAKLIEDDTIKQEPNDSGCVKVENFSESDISAVKTPENDVKPYIQFLENSSPPVKKLKKSDFIPVLCQIFKNSDPRTTKLPVFEFKVADNFFFYIFEKISLQNFKKTNNFDLTCAAFPKCRCKIKIEALITTDFTDEIFSKNRNWAIVPPKRKSTLIQSHICSTVVRVFPKLAKDGEHWSIRSQSQDFNVSQDIYISSLEKISDTACQFSVNHNGKNKNYVPALKVYRALPALLSSFRIDCTEKSDSSSLRVFAVETVDPDDATFWSPHNWKIKANSAKKLPKKKITLPRADYDSDSISEIESNSREIFSDSELDQISLHENFFELIKKPLFEIQKGGQSKKRAPRFRKRRFTSRYKLAKNKAWRLINKIKTVSNETQNFSRQLMSKPNLRPANKISDREIYSESDLDHVEMSEDFNLYLSKNIPEKGWAWDRNTSIKYHYDRDPDTGDPDYAPNFVKNDPYFVKKDAPFIGDFACFKKKKNGLSIDEKLWILNHRKENPKINQDKIALDFSAKFKKTISRYIVQKVLQKKSRDRLEAFVKANPELERKKIKSIGGNDEEEMVTLELIPENGPKKKKRVSLSMDEKLWILNHCKENPKMTQKKVALDFTAKFKKTMSRYCVRRVLQKKDRLEAFVKTDPELERKRIKNIGGNDEKEMVTLELIPENEDQK